MDFDFPGIAQAVLFDHIFRQPGKTRERVARENAAEMAHHITVIIILGRLDEIEVKCLSHCTGQAATRSAVGSEAGETQQSLHMFSGAARKIRRSTSVQNCTTTAVLNCCSMWMGQEDNRGEAAGSRRTQTKSLAYGEFPPG